AHQPDERRRRQFSRCLSEVDNCHDILFYAFLSSIWNCARLICNAGRHISSWYKAYCKENNVTSHMLESLAKMHTGLGSLEPEGEMIARKLRAKAHELAEQLWRENGCPDSGPASF